MKKIRYFIFFLITFYGAAQQHSFTIEWNGSKVLSTSNSSIELPHFNSTNFNFSHEEGVSFVGQWKMNSLLNENSAELTNLVFENISVSDLKELNIRTIPSKITYTVSNSISRNQKYGFVKVIPIINDNGIYKRIKSFTVKYNSKSQFSLKNSNSISNSVLSQGEWYKFYVDTTGVFKLSRSFLNSLGVNTNNVNPKNIRLFGQGGKMLPMLNSSNYPIDLKENAIKFVGEEDGVFNSSDYILLLAISCRSGVCPIHTPAWKSQRRGAK